MWFCIVASVLLAVLPSRCQSQSSADESNRIISYVNEVNLDGYKFAYESGDGTLREESGGFENGMWTVRGRVSWTSPEGSLFSYSYIADANGYRQSGAPGIFFPPPAFDSVPAAVPVFKGVDSYRGLVGGALISPNWKPPKPKQPERSK
ncbi:cuticular protein 47Eg-like isoform X2 [Nilaparvata lugens]|uniref:cuticular protein 47Eg-like isoform X2 n=1 Tax=Nilaparvata lugens TaxID=108931 RepID=UPI00193DCFAB|nr:cuticular protein 47Eg-like isoform X2 [Nilaparvata lugens]